MKMTRLWSTLLAATMAVTVAVAPAGNSVMLSEIPTVHVILLQTWLLAVPGTHLADWSAADFNGDGRLAGFDLCLMKRALVKS